MRTLALLLVLIPAAAYSQMQIPGPTPLTEALLIAQRPVRIPAEQWQRIVRNPANAAAYPIHLSQAMLDTLDTSQLDRRYFYVMMPDAPVLGKEPKQANRCADK